MAEDKGLLDGLGGVSYSSQQVFDRSSFDDQSRRRGTLSMKNPQGGSVRKSSMLPKPEMIQNLLVAEETVANQKVEVNKDKFALVQEHALLPLINLLTNFDEGVKQSTAKIINCLRVSEGCIMIDGPNAVEPFRTILALRGNDIAHKDALEALDMLAEECSHNQHKIMQEVGYSTIVDFMTDKNIDVQTFAVSLIGNLSQKADNRKQIIKAGGIQVLSDLVCSSENIKVKRKLAFSLANLLLEAHNVKKVSEKALGVLASWLSSEDEELEQGVSIFLANIANTEDNEIKGKIVQRGVVEVLSKLLKSRKNVVILKGVTTALANLTTQKKTRQLLLNEEGVVAALVKLGNDAKDDELRLGVVMTINNISTSVGSELLQCGAVALLKNLLKSSDADIVREAGEALAVLVPDHATSIQRTMSFLRETKDFSKSKTIKMVTDDDLQTLLICLSATDKNKVEIREAVKDLKELSSRAENSKKIVNLSGINPIVNILKYTLDANVKCDLLKILKFILEGSRAVSQNLMRESGLIPILFQILNKDIDDSINATIFDVVSEMSIGNVNNQMEMHTGLPAIVKFLKYSHSEKVKRKAARAIGAICLNNRKMQMAARKSGAISEMISSLNKKEFPYLQKHAAGALANIVADDVPNQDRMDKDGAIKVLVKILNETSDDELKCLVMVAGRAFIKGPHSKNQSTFRKFNVIPLCLQLLFSKNEALLAYTSGFLLELCKDNPKNQETLIYAGGVLPVVGVLQTSQNPQAIFNCLGLIYVTCRSNEKRRVAFKSSKAVEMIQKHLQSENENVKLAAQKALNAISPAI